MGILGIAVSLGGLMYLAYRGINVVILAPLMAIVACIFGGAPLLASYTEVFMPALGGYLVRYFPLFLLGAIFGKLMGDSGAAGTIGRVIAERIGNERAVVAVTLSCALLTYGGVSLFVVAFAMYPIARDLFDRGKVSHTLIPGAIALGSFTFTMTALPGTPAIQNAIPMPYFGTTLYAAPLLGTFAGLVMAGAGLGWLSGRAKRLPRRQPATAHEEVAPQEGPRFWVAIAPLLCVLLSNFVLTKFLLPGMDTSYLQSDAFGNKELQDVLGIWSIVLAMAAAIVLLLALLRSHLATPLESMNRGTLGSFLPIFNTASEVGYGATVASLPAFASIKAAILGIFPQVPLVSEAIAVNVLAGITGSASGGMSIALEALATQYLEMAEKTGVSPELLHRVASLAAGGLDTLPHNGAVITLLAICGMTHRQSYYDIFIVAVVIPFSTTAGIVVLGSLLGSF